MLEFILGVLLGFILGMYLTTQIENWINRNTK